MTDNQILQQQMDELEFKLADLQKAVDNTEELILKLATANNALIDVICKLTGFSPMDFIRERKEQ